MAHKALPDYFTTTFQKDLKRQIHSLFKAGILSDAARAAMLTSARSNTTLLGELLVLAYNVRVLADYEPEFPLEVKDSTYRLGTSTLAEASGWAGRANMHCKNLHKIWKDLGN